MTARIWICVILAAVLFGGCSRLKAISNANEAAHAFKLAAIPAIDEMCAAQAGACKAKGVTDVDKCGGLVKCRSARRAIYDVLNGVHLIAAMAAVAESAGQTDKLKAYAAEVKRLLIQLQDLHAAIGR